MGTENESNDVVTVFQRLRHQGGVWKTVEKSGVRTKKFGGELAASDLGAGQSDRSPIPLEGCSACAGDYEDPDRTARTPDGEEDEGGDDSPRATTEGFPAEE